MTSKIFETFEVFLIKNHRKLINEETAVKTWVEQKVSERIVLLKTDMVLNNKIYIDIADEYELYTYKRTKARELMQLQADAFFKHQKNAL